MAASIVTQNLSKTYAGAHKPALDKLSISVDAGEVYGFLGANGAGKSTTIRTLLNFIQPTDGSATILGFDVVKDSVKIRQHIGYLSGDVALYPKVTGAQLFEYLGKLEGGVSKEYLAGLVKRFDAQIHKPINTLSKGNRQKIGLIQALMHQPKILILDEPTSGLDPLMQEHFYDLIREEKKRGTAVFLSSHSLAEVQHMCDRVGIIRDGVLVREASVGELTEDARPIFTVVFKKAPSKTELAKQSALTILSLEGTNARLQTTSSIAAALRSLGRYDIVSLSVENDQLEDQFMSYYQHEEQTA